MSSVVGDLPGSVPIGLCLGTPAVVIPWDLGTTIHHLHLAGPGTLESEVGPYQVDTPSSSQPPIYKPPGFWLIYFHISSDIFIYLPNSCINLQLVENILY